MKHGLTGVSGMNTQTMRIAVVLFVFLGLHFAKLNAEARLIGQPAPEIQNQVWINSPALKMADLRGKVVLLQFWTYG